MRPTQIEEGWTRLLSSARETAVLGRHLGRLCRGGEIIGLVGELGTGKTCFVRGLAEGLLVPRDAWIRSPTFTLINEYHGRLALYHIDLYRVEEAKELEELNLRDYLYADGVSAVEWFDRLPAREMGEHLRIFFAHVDEERRRIHFAPRGNRYLEIVRALGLSRVISGGLAS